MNLKQDTLYIFTDGSCYPNPGPGGWGAILLYNGHLRLEYGGSEGETNNTMELRAILEGLRARKDHRVPTLLFTDSQYCVNALTKWWKGWEKRGWTTSSGSPVKNQDLIREIIHQADQVSFKWIKGHSGQTFNEAADRLARKGRALVENNPSENPPMEEIHEMLSPYVTQESFAEEALPFDKAAFVTPTTDTVKKPSLHVPEEALNMRDILAGVYFMSHRFQAILEDKVLLQDAYTQADRFLELRRRKDEK